MHVANHSYVYSQHTPIQFNAMQSNAINIWCKFGFECREATLKHEFCAEAEHGVALT
jgi:hypothetical protein